MWMTEYQLVCKPKAYICNVKCSLFLTNLSIKAHMQKHISKFLADIVIIGSHERITQLIDLLNSVWAKTFICLLPIPWTLLSENIQNIQKPAKSFHLLFPCMFYHYKSLLYLPCKSNKKNGIICIIQRKEVILHS